MDKRLEEMKNYRFILNKKTKDIDCLNELEKITFFKDRIILNELFFLDQTFKTDSFLLEKRFFPTKF